MEIPVGLNFKGLPLCKLVFSLLVSFILNGCSDNSSLDSKNRSVQSDISDEGAVSAAVTVVIDSSLDESTLEKVIVNGASDEPAVPSVSGVGELEGIDGRINNLTSSLTGRELSQSLASLFDDFEDATALDIIDALESLPSGGVSERALRRGVAMITEIDPALAIDWAVSSSELTDMERSAVIGDIGYLWGGADPVAAMGYAKSQKQWGAHVLEDFTSEVISSWVSSDAAAALSEVNSLVDESPEFAMKVLSSPSTVADLLRESDSFLTSLSSSPASDLAENSSWMNVVGGAWAKVDPKRGMEWINVNLSSEKANLARQSLFSQWIRDVPADALSWAARLRSHLINA